MRPISYPFLLCLLLLAIPAKWLRAQHRPQVINDVTQLNPVAVAAVLAPVNTTEIQQAVLNHAGPISVGGGRYSMGGQTATENSLHLDMRAFNKVLHFSEKDKEITVQAGITWRSIQEFIDPYNLSVRIMQTYANFTIGGSLSVNAHGRYVGQGPLILSVKEIKLVLANGELVTASPMQNPEIFYGAVGGYGGLGVITEATLLLTENCRVQRTDKVMPVKQYRQYFFDQVRSDSLTIFHNADFYPKRYKKVRAVSYTKTSREATIAHRLKPNNQAYKANRFAFWVISELPGGKWIRQHLLDPLFYVGQPVEWRNYEASYDVRELEPKSRKKATYVLQEYFVPVQQFDAFYPRMAATLRKHKVNAINISIRHAKPDPGSLLAWARTEVFAFVLYYKQGTSPADREKVKHWTRELIDQALACQGTYYLPYQIHAEQHQFLAAYPQANRFFALKKQLDPTNKFRNKLWDQYYRY